MKIKFTELNSGYSGEKQISRLSRENRSKAIIALTLVCAFLFVFLLSTIGVLPLDAVFLRAKVGITGNDQRFPIVMNTDSTLDMEIIGESIILLTTENVAVYSPNGRMTYSQPHVFAKPAISVDDDREVAIGVTEEVFGYTMEKGTDVEFMYFGLLDGTEGRYDCNWTSTNTSVATVDSATGKVTAKKEGFTVLCLTLTNKTTSTKYEARPIAIEVVADGTGTVATATPMPTKPTSPIIQPTKKPTTTTKPTATPTELPEATATPVPTTAPVGEDIAFALENEFVAQERMKALVDAVRCRETTNQKLLDFYVKMYEDLRESTETVLMETQKSLLHISDKIAETCDEDDTFSALKEIAEMITDLTQQAIKN